jgi:hypothetical protein
MRAAARCALAVAAVLLLPGCSLFGDDDDGPGELVSTFTVKSGDCVVPPDEVAAELADLRVVPCETPHTQEAYAVIGYAGGTEASRAADAPYPGDVALKTFADGACAEAFEGYVGRPYADSSLFFTYLLPSPRSWQADDRNVVCLVTTTGEPLTSSVRGSRL